MGPVPRRKANILGMVQVCLVRCRKGFWIAFFLLLRIEYPGRSQIPWLTPWLHRPPTCRCPAGRTDRRAMTVSDFNPPPQFRPNPQANPQPKSVTFYIFATNHPPSPCHLLSLPRDTRRQKKMTIDICVVHCEYFGQIFTFMD